MKRLLVLASVVMAVGSCSSTAGQCSACDGCCNESGVCQPGSKVDACGLNGVACNVCSNGQTCTSGDCVGGSSGGGTATGGGSGGGSAGGSGGGTDASGGGSGGGSQDNDPTCTPCTSNADCTAAGTTCVHYAGGTFCGTACTTSNDCASIESCLAAIATDTPTQEKVCVPLSGTCSDTGCGTCGTGQTCDPIAGRCLGGTGGGAGGGTGTGGGSHTGGGTAGTGGGTGLGSALTIIVEPSDNAVALRDAISTATTSVHMTMYQLSNTDIIDALIYQKNAGHEVEVILNQNFPTGGSNATVYSQLQTAGIAVKYAPSNFTLTHEKCVILDKKTAWIMTMNATATSPSSNREYLAIDNNASEVAEAEAIFEADFADMSITPTGTLVVAPNNAESRLTAALDTATLTIDMEGEELSDNDNVTAMVAAAGKGVKVQIVLSDGTPTAAQSTAVTKLKAAGVKLVTLHTPYIHAKSFVIDLKLAYIGSENFTSSSLNDNRELGVLFTIASEVQKVLTQSRADFVAGTAL